MNCTILLHSTTGNTRLLARFAAACLEKAGWTVRIHDILRHRSPPPLNDVDLLGVACPTMYFRGTLAMEQFVARLPSAHPGPKPAFQLATAGSDAGAQFAILAQELQHKDWITLGAHLVTFINNWPPHRIITAKIPGMGPLSHTIDKIVPSLRQTLHWVHPDIGEPFPRARPETAAFMRDIAVRAGTGDLTNAPTPAALYRGNPLFYAIGQLMTVDKMRYCTNPQIDASRCGRCGSCVKVCPVTCLTQAHEDAVPVVGDTCTGCWACYNHCPDEAISGWGSPAGIGRYRGPSAEARNIFAIG